MNIRELRRKANVNALGDMLRDELQTNTEPDYENILSRTMINTAQSRRTCKEQLDAWINTFGYCVKGGKICVRTELKTLNQSF